MQLYNIKDCNRCINNGAVRNEYFAKKSALNRFRWPVPRSLRFIESLRSFFLTRSIQMITFHI